jgi:hypothetical protein
LMWGVPNYLVLFIHMYIIYMCVCIIYIYIYYIDEYRQSHFAIWFCKVCSYGGKTRRWSSMAAASWSPMI